MSCQRILCFVLVIAPMCVTIAQRPVVPGWHLLDRADDGYQGISIKKAGTFLANKKPVSVIVAVLDGGVDTTHAALKPWLWQNKQEVAANGVDDDGNGYVDDLYGWNFLGNASGRNVEKETAEAIRLYHKLKPSFEAKQGEQTPSIDATSPTYQLWIKVNKQLDLKPEERFTLSVLQASNKAMVVYDSVIQQQYQRTTYSFNDLEGFVPNNPDGKKAKHSLLRFANLLQIEDDKTNTELLGDVQEFIDRYQSLQNARAQQFVNQRLLVTGDSEDDFSSQHYGNADVMGGSSLHGTHVSGIIAGMAQQLGSAQQPAIKVLPVRMVPKGDEHDKDVALGIRYAVDNGAKVINMSFGKDFSPYKHWVDDAIRYAAAHDVLVVHAAGNDAENMDTLENYPSAHFDDNTWAPNMITVGASGDSSLKCGLVADFTNFGVNAVDVLAPGVKIYSTVPGGGYAYEQGTSMAAPIVSGIAAIIRSYYPQLSAVQVRQAIEQSTDNAYTNVLVRVPGSTSKKDKTTIGELCKTGGIANAFLALQIADRMAAATATAISPATKHTVTVRN